MIKRKITDLKITKEFGLYVAKAKVSCRMKATITAKGKTPEEALRKINSLINPEVNTERK